MAGPADARPAAPAEPVGREFSNIVIELALASLPGFTASSSPPQPGRAFGFYKPGYVPQTDVPHVAVLADGTRIEIPPPSTMVEEPARPPVVELAGAAGQYRDHERRPLGDLAYARSGDKGGDANVGVWVRQEKAWRWLAHNLTVELFQELLPETRPLTVTRYLLPNLWAVNFVVEGLLGEGVAASEHLTRAGVADGLRRVKQLPATSGHDGTLMGFGTWDHAALKGHYLVLRTWRDGHSVQV